MASTARREPARQVARLGCRGLLHQHFAVGQPQVGGLEAEAGEGLGAGIRARIDRHQYLDGAARKQEVRKRRHLLAGHLIGRDHGRHHRQGPELLTGKRLPVELVEPRVVSFGLVRAGDRQTQPSHRADHPSERQRFTVEERRR